MGNSNKNVKNSFMNSRSFINTKRDLTPKNLRNTNKFSPIKSKTPRPIRKSRESQNQSQNLSELIKSCIQDSLRYKNTNLETSYDKSQKKKRRSKAERMNAKNITKQ